VYSSNQHASSLDNAYTPIISFVWLPRNHHCGVPSVIAITQIHVAPYALPAFPANDHRTTINLIGLIRKHRMPNQQDETVYQTADRRIRSHAAPHRRSMRVERSVSQETGAQESPIVPMAGAVMKSTGVDISQCEWKMAAQGKFGQPRLNWTCRQLAATLCLTCGPMNSVCQSLPAAHGFHPMLSNRSINSQWRRCSPFVTCAFAVADNPEPTHGDR